MIRNLRFIERNGKKLLQAEYQIEEAIDTEYEWQWEDVPFLEEEAE